MTEGRRRRRWPWAAAVVVIAAGGAAWWLLGAFSESEGETAAEGGTDVAEVVIADLTETEEFAGTLGRSTGDPVLSRLDGTITSTAQEGDTIAQGDILYRVDGEPVVLLFGAQPAFRDIGLEPEMEAVVNHVEGTLTSVADEGTLLQSGDILYAVADEPVVLLYGDLPAYRTLRNGVEAGPDTQQLEQALVDLGYDPDGDVTINENFTAVTEAMVERWQEDIGAEEDGVVELGEVVFLPGPVEVEMVTVAVGQAVRSGESVMTVVTARASIAGADVAQLEAALAELGYPANTTDDTFDSSTEAAVGEWQKDIGAERDGVVDLGEVVFLPEAIRVIGVVAVAGTPIRDGGQVLATSSAETVVTVALPAADQGKMAEGGAVTVVLPDGTRTPGTITEVGTVASTDAQGESTFEVEIVLDDPAAAAGLDEAPVDVEVLTDSREDVMAVPVTALIALREGGYAVEVEVGSGDTRLVAVDPGFYSEGLVEVVSNGLRPGDRVVVP